MKIQLLCVGKLRDKSFQSLCDDFEKRLKRYGSFEIKELKPSKARQPEEAVREENARILDALNTTNTTWILDERGKSYTSVDLSKEIEKLELRATKGLTVVLGGAYGLSDEVRAKGKLLSLSKMTFNHELCRLIVLEQLYRARTIQNGEPYHHA